MAVLEGFGKNRSDFPIADAGAVADPEVWPARQGARGRVRGWRGSSTQRGSGETHRPCGERLPGCPGALRASETMVDVLRLGSQFTTGNVPLVIRHRRC